MGEQLAMVARKTANLGDELLVREVAQDLASKLGRERWKQPMCGGSTAGGGAGLHGE